MKKYIFFAAVICMIVSCRTQMTGKKTTVEGNWKLSYISDEKAKGELLGGRRPIMSFHEDAVSGNTTCNSFSGKFALKGKKIDFNANKLVSTMMACGGNGETAFMTALQQVDNFKLENSGKLLNLKSGDVIILAFEKQ